MNTACPKQGETQGPFLVLLFLATVCFGVFVATPRVAWNTRRTHIEDTVIPSQTGGEDVIAVHRSISCINVGVQVSEFILYNNDAVSFHIAAETAGTMDSKLFEAFDVDLPTGGEAIPGFVAQGVPEHGSKGEGGDVPHRNGLNLFVRGDIPQAGCVSDIYFTDDLVIVPTGNVDGFRCVVPYLGSGIRFGGTGKVVYQKCGVRQVNAYQFHALRIFTPRETNR